MESESTPSTRLIWQQTQVRPATAEPILELEQVSVNPVLNSQPRLESMDLNRPRFDSPLNHYHYGDNYALLQALICQETKIDLIYIDPPYMTNLDYVSTITVGGYAQHQRINRLAFQDRWEQGLDSFLEMLYPRLKAMYQVLAAHGSIFVHVDWHVSHYVRVLLDEIFGPENFVNEIVWCYGGGSSTRRRFHRKHDLIFWYSRSSEYIYNPQFRPYTSGTLERGLTKVKGDQYKLHGEGALMQDWWMDVGKILSPTAYENLKYPTQKPLALIRRVIEAASNPGSVVADFFCGSGTLAEVANQTGRNWIMCDASSIALQTCLYRLIRSDSPPFTVTGTAPSAQPENQRISVKTELSTDGRGWLLYIDLIEFQPAVELPADHHFSEFIEFWELDLNYDRKVFQSHLQIIRGRRFKEPLATNLQVRLLTDHDFTLAVKVHDVWGHQTMTTVNIELA